MKWLARTIVVVITMSLASVAFAEDAADGKKPADGEKKRVQRREGHGDRMKKMREMHAKRMEALGLTDEQKAKQKEIHAGMEEAMKALKTKREALMGQMKEAREAKDKEKMAAVHAEFKKLGASHREVFQEAHKKFEAILNDEQKAKLKKMGPPRGHHGRPGVHGWPSRGGRHPMVALKMTDEQKKQAHAIMEAAKKKIHDEVLTDEQRAQIEKMKESHKKRREGGKKRDSEAKPE